MGTNKRKRAVAEKPSGEKKRTAVEEIKEPFALVLYFIDKTKGVVRTKSILKKNRVRGNDCMAPDPVDFHINEEKPSSSKERTYNAKVIEFGYNINYLYNLKLLKDGSVDNNCDSELLLALKREYKDNADFQDSEKADNLKNIDLHVANIPCLVILNQEVDSSVINSNNEEKRADIIDVGNYEIVIGNDDGTTSFISSLQFADPSSKIKVADSLAFESGEDGKSVITQTSGHISPQHFEDLIESTSSSTPKTGNCEWNKENEISDISEKGDDSDILTMTPKTTIASLDVSLGENVEQPQKSNGKDVLFSKCPGNSSKCPLLKVLNEASPENLIFLQKLQKALSDHEVCQKDLPQEITPNLEQQTLSLGEDIQNFRQETQNFGQQETQNFDTLECFQYDPNKFHLVKDISVYVKRSELLSLPGIQGNPNASGTSTQKLVTPTDMIRLLTDILLPKEIKRGIKSSNIPRLIILAIQGYINLRQPEHERLLEGTIREKIYNVCRCVKRDRVQEAMNREEKIKRGEQIKSRKKKPKIAEENFVRIPLKNIVNNVLDGSSRGISCNLPILSYPIP